MNRWLFILSLGALLTAARAELPIDLPPDTPTNRPGPGINVPAPRRGATSGTNEIKIGTEPAPPPPARPPTVNSRLRLYPPPRATNDWLRLQNQDLVPGRFLGWEDGALRWEVADALRPVRFRGRGKPVQTALPATAEPGGLHFADYAAFKAAIWAKAKATVNGNRAAYIAASGGRVTLTWDGQAKLPDVERDGQPHDWDRHRALWQGGPVTLGWKEGRLAGEAGGKRFTGTLDLTCGTYTFANEPVFCGGF